MYIPQPLRRSDGGASAATAAGRSVLVRAASAIITGLRKRDENSTNITIGIVVAIVLAIFLGGIGYFLWRYRKSVRFKSKHSRRSKRRRRKSHGSKSSKSSSDSGAPPPPAPPPAAPPAE